MGYTLDIMNTTTIHVKIDTKTKFEAKKVAEEFGLSLTALVNAMLKQIARTKQLYLNVGKEEPTEYFKQLIREADEDVKAGRIISFKNPQEEFRYLDKLIENDKKIKQS